jgi:hypothetical protein
MENILGILLLATFVEGLINYLFGEGTGEGRSWIKYVSLVAGVLVAIAYKVDIFVMAGLNPVFPAIGYIVTGIVIGRGSNYLNDFVGLLRKP